MSEPKQYYFFAEKRGAEFNREKTFRYKLWRIWDTTKPLVMLIGVNPSTADSNDDDNTVKRCISFANNWGYGGFYIVNLFAYIATDPKNLKRKLATSLPGELAAMNEINNQHIMETAKLCDRIVFVWGAIGGTFPDRCKEVAEMFPDNTWCIRRTKKGHPEHPLFLPGDLKLIPY